MRFSIRMSSKRLADTPSPARRRRAPASLPLASDEPVRSARDLLLHSWPGRLFIISALLKVVVWAVRLVGELPTPIRLISTAATIGLAFSLLFFTTRLVFLVQRRLLWRVRRKLILSYIFIGVVPALLIVGFFLLGADQFAGTVSAYLFRDGYDEISRGAESMADAAAAEITRSPKTVDETIARVQRNGSKLLQSRTVSVVFIPATANATPVSAGLWEHLRPPPDALPDLPEWVRNATEGFIQMTSVQDGSGDPELIVRAVRPTGPAGARTGWVIVDAPLDPGMMNRLHEMTGARGGSVSLADAAADAASETAQRQRIAAAARSGPSLFRNTVTILDAVDWATGRPQRATIALSFRLGELFNRLSRAQSILVQNQRFGDLILTAVVFVAVLFVIIWAVALVMGLALARSITSSIHELFMGTERVRQGDFTHRIKIQTKDQLGDLASSFNQMTGSIENLLQTAAEKKRLEEELRIARQIQMSLLPRGQLDMQGLGITALCVPAREVGGDYYDFFPLGDDRLGVLIADVSGKGTSAALYMAELKGLVLSLSQIYQSPRQLLIEANRILSDNLDSRSFITMTYAVIDLPNSVMTYARAGHTPLIYLPATASRKGAQILIPNGMVLGLRIDGAAVKFAELLEEVQIPLSTGDVILFYTDGITEAMNTASDLFGEARLSRIIEEHSHLDSGELRERILREVEAFVGTADQHDDMTMILIKVEHAAAAVKVAV
jgi:sigma-B regulation protein RsbU (phosphoserine phosphatase)